MILGCMTELPCPYQKDFEGAEHCMKEEGNCEYQILNSEDDKKARTRLTVTNNQGYWLLKGVPWESMGEGQVITKNVQERIYGALCKLKDYEDTGYSPENVEHLRYILEDAVMELEKCQGETELTKEIWHYLKEY